MATQRIRRPQPQQPVNQGPILNHQQRETSPSPTLRDRDRPRAAKAQSMPMVPSITAFPPQPPLPSQNTQPSPNLPNNGARRSPPQVPRVLPNPPQQHTNPPFEQERRTTPPPVQQQQQQQQPTNPNQHYARSAPRAPVTTYPNRLQNIEENWQMTPELLADVERDIERVDQQQYLQAAQPPMAYPPNNEQRLSPINLDNNQQRPRRELQVPRESPKTRDRHPASPMGNSIEATLTPERRLSPAPIATESHPANYTAHYNTRETPPVLRRAPAAEQRVNPSITNPPMQAIAARTPDRSLPVQEEDENSGQSQSRVDWQDTDTVVESQFSSSPTPSSDLNPDGNVQRFDSSGKPGLHDEDKMKLINHDEDRPQYSNRDSTEDEGGYTPRSPTAALPEDNNEPYYPGPIRVPAPVPLRPKGRNGSGDVIMRGLESTLMESKQAPPPAPVPPPPPQQQQQQQQQHQQQQQAQAQAQAQHPKYVEQRQPVPLQPNVSHYQKPYLTHQQDYAYANHPINRNGRYPPPQPHVYPDDFPAYTEDPTSAYIQSYFSSPRPDAPVPPTPHTATAAPSPSPMLSDYGIPPKATTPAYTQSQRAAGSPYPFPFNHVRRTRQNQNSRLIANGLDPATITEQIARQWQIFAQNNHGNITDSTLSPSSTPFQGDLFDHWAYLHTNRMMKGLHDAPSLHSSPSHQPIPLPIPPNFGSRKQKKNPSARKQPSYSRKPPPRVESTQPRDTSPELSSSGEETAGDERVANPTPDIVTNTNGETVPIMEIPIENLEADESGEWVDDEDEDDYDDLIDLEYHPSFVKNVSRRRRRWEVGWENLIQSFQALDRQTDATMILLASPSHSTKLYALRSRSVRRQSVLSTSASMNEIRTGFSRLASQRRKSRPERSSSLADRLLSTTSSSTTADGSDGSSQSVEENLRRALDVALSSLGALGEVYEQREARVLEELQRSREDRERVELLLKQVLGEKNPLSHPVPLLSP